MTENGRFTQGRHAGVLVPLFSIPSRSSWGIGEIADLPRFARWLEAAGLDFVQLLPVNEMQRGQSSPYSALSAMAIDPIYIAIGEPGSEADLIARARSTDRVDYETIRAAKDRAFTRMFDAFMAQHHGTGSADERAFAAFRDRERWWLDDYALFRALHEENGARYWLEWEEGLRTRQPDALEQARTRLARDILFYQYLQWLAQTQWEQARADCGRIGIVGDFPFMVSGHSADVWAHQHEFRTDASVGVPPDAFSETGQDWGLPVYRWDVLARNDYDWLRQRAQRCVELYDGYRVDHLVGFYRTFVRERDGRTYFVPADQPSQIAQGEALLTIFRDSGEQIIAEDLGVVPEFVRDSLTRLGIPGLKVMRWEREWKQPGEPFREPSQYPENSVAISGTHDTETVREWWETATPEERAACASLPSLARLGVTADAAFTPAVRDALIAALLHSGSRFVLLPIQDIFGWRDRINVPASVDARNWTWRLPWPVEDLLTQPDAVERAAFLRRLSRS